MDCSRPNLRSVINTDDYATARGRLWWATVVVVAIWSILMLQTATARASADCPAGATMNIVAHPDDDLLFQSPDVLHDVQSGKCVRTVYVSQVAADDDSSAYTKQELTSTLTALMNAMQPETIRTLDYVGSFGDGDHDDHHATAYFARSAHLDYATTHTFIGYQDYASEGRPQNVFDPDLTTKTNVFYAYLAWDAGPCGAPPHEC